MEPDLVDVGDVEEGDDDERKLSRSGIKRKSSNKSKSKRDSKSRRSRRRPTLLSQEVNHPYLAQLLVVRWEGFIDMRYA